MVFWERYKHLMGAWTSEQGVDEEEARPEHSRSISHMLCLTCESGMLKERPAEHNRKPAPVYCCLVGSSCVQSPQIMRLTLTFAPTAACCTFDRSEVPSSNRSVEEATVSPSKASVSAVSSVVVAQHSRLESRATRPLRRGLVLHDAGWIHTDQSIPPLQVQTPRTSEPYPQLSSRVIGSFKPVPAPMTLRDDDWADSECDFVLSEDATDRRKMAAGESRSDPDRKQKQRSLVYFAGFHLFRTISWKTETEPGLYQSHLNV